MSNSGSTLARERCLCNHASIEGSLSSRAFHRNLSEGEKENDGKREIKGERVQRKGEGKCFCSPQLSSPIHTVNKHAADEEECRC